MNSLTEQLEQLAELQKKSLEPLHRFNNDALAAFERVARKNHELIGDVVDFAVAQSRSQVEGDTPQAVYERQIVEARAFAEKISSRAAEYAELAADLKENTMSNLPSASDWAAGAVSTGKAAEKPAAKASADVTPVAAATTSAKTTKNTAAKVVAKAAPKSSSQSGPKASSKATAKKTAAPKVSSKKKPAGKSAASRAKA